MQKMPALGESCPRSLSTSQTIGLVMMSPLRIKISEHAQRYNNHYLPHHVFCTWLVLLTLQHVRPFQKLRFWVSDSSEAEPKPRSKRNWRITLVTLTSKPVIIRKKGSKVRMNVENQYEKRNKQGHKYKMILDPTGGRPMWRWSRNNLSHRKNLTKTVHIKDMWVSRQ